MGQSPPWGRPAPQVQLEIQLYGVVGCVQFEGTALPKGRNIVSWKSPVGWVNMLAYNFSAVLATAWLLVWLGFVYYIYDAV